MSEAWVEVDRLEQTGAADVWTVRSGRDEEVWAVRTGVDLWACLLSVAMDLVPRIRPRPTTAPDEEAANE